MKASEFLCPEPVSTDTDDDNNDDDLTAAGSEYEWRMHTTTATPTFSASRVEAATTTALHDEVIPSLDPRPSPSLRKFIRVTFEPCAMVRREKAWKIFITWCATQWRHTEKLPSRVSQIASARVLDVCCTREWRDVNSCTVWPQRVKMTFVPRITWWKSSRPSAS